MMRQKLATLFASAVILTLKRGMFASQKVGTSILFDENTLWHNFCIIGLRPSNLRPGCREIRKFPVICIKGA
jgi:hypothetical protein